MLECLLQCYYTQMGHMNVPEVRKLFSEERPLHPMGEPSEAVLWISGSVNFEYKHGCRQLKIFFYV